MLELATTLGFVPAWPMPTGVNAFVTTRAGGHSLAPYESNNLALHVGDDPSRVERNRRQLIKALQLPNEPQWLQQAHGTQITQADTDGVIREADGSITAEVGRVCAVLTADCLPVLLCDQQGTQVAAVHAGWRGLAGGIIARAINEFGMPADELSVYLGPAICQQCYEVDDRVRRVLLNTLATPSSHRENISCPVPNKPGHHLVSLVGVAKAQLHRLGVSQIFGGDICNSCDDRFFSYRRDRADNPLSGDTGRFATLIWRC